MNILFSCDDNYAKYLAVTMLSIIHARDKNNECYTIHFYLLDMGISTVAKDYCIELANKNNCRLDITPINISDFEKFPRTIEYISLSTYARLNLASYLKNLI